MFNLATSLKKWSGETVKSENSGIKRGVYTPPRLMTKSWDFTTDFLYFRKMLGNPISKITNEEHNMAPFQIDYHNSVQMFHWVILLKSRKIGATEAANTSIALNCFDRYVGHDIMIIAGNELRIAKEILLRFYELFMDKPHAEDNNNVYAFRNFEPEWIYEVEKGRTPKERQKLWDYYQGKGTRIKESDLLKSVRLAQDPVVEFKNGTRTFAFAASKQEKAQTFRGTDDVICIFFSEAAHTGMKQDQPIMNALKPNLAQRKDADFIMESTGNGRRAIFFNYWQQMMEVLSNKLRMKRTEEQKLIDELHRLWKEKTLQFKPDWFPLRINYEVGIKTGILSKDFIEKEKRDPALDFEQEYNCAFTSTYTAAIDVSNLQTLPSDKADTDEQDLLSLVGKKSYQ